MTVYNITTKIEPGIASAWLDWQQREHMPAIMKTGLFDECKIFRLAEQDDTEGPTFIIQYVAASMENCKSYIDRLRPAFTQEEIDKWGNGFISFRTIMEAVQ